MNRAFLSALAPLIMTSLAAAAAAEKPQVVSQGSVELKGAYSSAWIDDDMLVVGGLANSARLVDVSHGAPVVKDVFTELARHRSISERAGILLAVACDVRDRQKKRIIVGGTGGVVETWNPNRTQPLDSSWSQPRSPIKLLAREPSGPRFAASDGERIAIYTNLVRPTVLPAGKSNVASMIWLDEPGLGTASPEALIVGREDGRYELREGDMTTVSEGFVPFESGSDRFISVQRREHGETRIASLGDDSVYRLWKVTPAAQLPHLQEMVAASRWVLARSGKLLAAADESWLYLWSLPARTLNKVPIAANAKPIAIAADDGGNCVALLADVNGQRTISLAFGQFTKLVELDLTLNSAAPPPNVLSCIAISPDGQRIAVGYNTGEILVGDLNLNQQAGANGNVAVSVCRAGKDEQLSGIRFVGNKPLLISSSCACRMTIWNTDDATVAERIPTARSIGAWDVVVMKDGPPLVAAGLDSPNSDVLLAYLNRDGAVNHEMWTQSPKSDGVVSLHFTEDGGHLTTTSSDGCLRTWDTQRLVDHIDPDGKVAVDTGLIEAVIPQGGELTDGWFWGDDRPVMSIVKGRAQFSRFTARARQALVPGKGFHPAALSCDLKTAVFLDKGSTLSYFSLPNGDPVNATSDKPNTISLAALGSLQLPDFRNVYVLPNPDPANESSRYGNAQAKDQTEHLLTIQADGKTICHWDPDSGELISSVALEKGAAFLCAGSADKRVLAVLADSSIESLDFSERKAENITVGTFPAKPVSSSSMLTALEFAADDYSVIAGYADGTIKRHLIGAEDRRRLDPSRSIAPLYTMLVDKEVGVVFGYADGSIQAPDIPAISHDSNKPLYALAKDPTPNAQRIFYANYSPNLTRLSFADDRIASVVSIQLSDSGQYYTSVSTSSGFVAAGFGSIAGNSGMVHRWKLSDWNADATAERLAGDGAWESLPSAVDAVAYSPKGKWLAAVKSGRDKSVGLLQLWDKNGKHLNSLQLPAPKNGSVLYCGLSWNGSEDRLAITSVLKDQLDADNDLALVLIQMK